MIHNQNVTLIILEKIINKSLIFFFIIMHSLLNILKGQNVYQLFFYKFMFSFVETPQVR